MTEPPLSELLKRSRAVPKLGVRELEELLRLARAGRDGGEAARAVFDSLFELALLTAVHLRGEDHTDEAVGEAAHTGLARVLSDASILQPVHVLAAAIDEALRHPEERKTIDESLESWRRSPS